MDENSNAGDLLGFVGQAVQTCRVRSETWQLVTKRAPFVLLTGDSGTGKTSVLLESQTEYAAATLAPPPTACMFDSGALQVALLDALSAAMAMHDSEESGWRKLGNRITHASRETALEMGKSLRDALVQELLNLVKSRLGQDVGQGLLAFVKGLRSDDRETLRRDIRSRSDGNVVRLLVRLADEVAETLDRDIVIALDDADRLSDADQRILAGVAARPPQRVRMIAAYFAAAIELQGTGLVSPTPADQVVIHAHTAFGAPRADALDALPTLSDRGLLQLTHAGHDTARPNDTGVAVSLGDEEVEVVAHGRIQSALGKTAIPHLADHVVRTHLENVRLESYIVISLAGHC